VLLTQDYLLVFSNKTLRSFSNDSSSNLIFENDLSFNQSEEGYFDKRNTSSRTLFSNKSDANIEESIYSMELKYFMFYIISFNFVSLVTSVKYLSKINKYKKKTLMLYTFVCQFCSSFILMFAEVSQTNLILVLISAGIMKGLCGRVPVALKVRCYLRSVDLSTLSLVFKTTTIFGILAMSLLTVL
ncbi:hypothetical protein Avbf_18671, partial [Armadillidium vulgare]